MDRCNAAALCNMADQKKAADAIDPLGPQSDKNCNQCTRKLLTNAGQVLRFPTSSGFQSSSMVEQSAVNRSVVGSSPTSGATSSSLYCGSLPKFGIAVFHGLLV